MIKVECVSCKAPYELDERRIPEKGMKMRCPKCGTSFQVTRSGVVAQGAGPAAGPSPAIAAPPPAAAIAPPFAGASPKSTMLGAAPAPAPAPAPVATAQPARPPMGTMLGIAPPTAGATKDALKPPAGALGGGARGQVPAASSSAAKGAFGAGPKPPAAEPAAASPVLDLDLPAPVSGQKGTAPKAAAPSPLSSLEPSDLSVSNIRIDQLPMPKREVDLPRPQGVASPPRGGAVQSEIDLSAPKASAFDADLPAPKASAFDADLPAPKASVFDADLPAPKASAFDADLPAPKASAFDADLPAPKASAFDADLPAPKAARPVGMGAGSSTLDATEVDLPAPKVNADLPKPKAPLRAGTMLGNAPLAPTAPFVPPAPLASPGFADLPAPKSEADLPAPKGGSFEFGDLDLPAPKVNADLPTAKRGGGVDLPAPKASVDLPTPKGQVDLPKPRSGGVRFGEIDLPTPKVGGVDLPAPRTVDLPAPRDDLPTPRMHDDSSFADVMLDLPDLGSDEAATPDDVFGDIELPPPKPAADMVASRERTIQGSARRMPTMPQQPAEEPLGDSELPPSLLGGDESSFGDLNDEVEELSFSEPPAAPAPRSALRGPSGPEVSMPPSLGDVSEDELLDDDLVGEEGEYDEGDDFGEEEFEGDEYEDEDRELELGLSADDEGRASLAPDALRRQRGEDFEARQAALRKRTVTIVVRLAALLVLLTAGAAALAFTEYGIFGIYYWEKWLPEAGDEQFARSAIQKAEKMAATDTYADVQRSLKELGSARAKAGINRHLLSRGLVHEALFIVRFGDDPGSAARAAAILKRLEERSGHAPEMDLARAADAARRKAYVEAQKHLASARKQGPRDPYVELLAGEVAFVQAKYEDADKAFAQALKLGGAARAQWGLARVALAGTDREAQAASVNETLKLSSMHVDARIAEARIVWSQGKEERGLHLLQVALGREPTEDDRYLWSAKSSMATGYSVLGYVHESRGRLHMARQAYDQALKADAYRVEALLGAGRVLLREGRAGDALPRFESALKSATKGGENPTVLSGRHADTEAQLGIGRVLLTLDRVPEAKAKLLELSTALPEDAEVALALGETEEKLGNTDRAEAEMRRSIKLSPTRFDGYLALSQLFFRQGNAARASEVLNQAAAQVEETAHMRRMLGQSELARNRLESAAHEFRRALELDPYDIEAKFGLGVALRRGGELEAAETVFAAIAQRDSHLAGLAEQRGLLLEARGKFQDAVVVYNAALEKDPTNVALVLRLGAAQVLAGALDDAEQTLARVIREIPNSAEAEYFIGRVAFGRGRTADALTHFDRAMGLDNSKAEYHLYVARSTWELGNFARTLEEAEAALKRDPSLGDAYWVRAMVRQRMGQVRDALKDLDRALKLNPARIEAHAVRGDCYEQLRQLGEAITAYRTALAGDEKRGQWWYRLAGLLSDAGDHSAAENALRRAVETGEKTEPLPHWLSDAYRLSGENAERAGNRQAAIRHYKRYVQITSTSAIDYRVVMRKLRDWGVELGDEE